MVAGLTLRSTTYKNSPKTPNFSMNNPLVKKTRKNNVNKANISMNNAFTKSNSKNGFTMNNPIKRVIRPTVAPSGPSRSFVKPKAPGSNTPSTIVNTPPAPVNKPAAAVNTPAAIVTKSQAQPEVGSMSGSSNLSQAMSSLNSAATGSVKVVAKSLDAAVQIADKSVNVGRDTTLKTIETAGVIADVALDVTQKAATTAGEIATVALDTTKEVVAEAGRVTKVAAKTTANVVEGTGRIVSASAKTAAEITETAGLYASGTAKIAAKTALEVQAKAGEVTEAAAATAAELSKSALAASQKVGTAALDASADVTAQSIDVVSTTLGSSLTLAGNSINSTINGINNIVTLIGRAGARLNEKLSTSQDAKDKIQAALGFTEALKHELRSELIKFSKDFKDSLINFKSVQLQALGVVHTVLKSEYCLGPKGTIKRYFTSVKCPAKSESNNVDAMLKQHMQELDTKSKMIFGKVEIIIKQFDSSKIALLKLSPSDADETIKNFKEEMDKMMDNLAKYVTQTETLYTSKIDWVQKKLDDRTNKLLTDLGNTVIGGRRTRNRQYKRNKTYRRRRY